MAQPIAVAAGTCFAFPDMLLTPAPSGSVPLPYPNIAQLAAAQGTAANVTAGGQPGVLESSTIPTSSGGEAGTGGGVANGGESLKACTFSTCSATVRANGKGVGRQADTTSQNNDNAVGSVMTGVPTVLVGC